MKATCTILLALFTLQLFSQGFLKGNIKDTAGERVPYATIFVKELSFGTTANSTGEYEVKLKPATYHLQFRSVGCISKELVLTVDSSVIYRDIVLEDQIFQIGEVRITPNHENPAYPIMRRTISMAPYYMNQVKKYVADVYLKGTVKLEKVPKILSKRLKVQINDVVLSERGFFVGESFSEIEFQMPNIYKQKIISSSMSIKENQQQTFNMGLITNSVYSPEFEDMVMPLSPQAFSYYDFKFEGSSSEGNYLIDKVKFTPRRKSKMLFSGYLYVVDGLWCLNNIELEAKQSFGKIDANIQLAEVRNNVWLPVSHTIAIDGGMMGVKGKANYTSSVKYKSVDLNNDLVVPPILTEFFTKQKENESEKVVPKSKRQQKIDEIMSKDDLTNREAVTLARLLKKEAAAMNTDSSGKKSLEVQETYLVEKADSATSRPMDYWANIRPNPLTKEENASYVINDSLQKVKSAKVDTVKNRKSFPTFIPAVLFGYQFRWNGDSTHLKYGGIISPDLLQFNPVEGWKYGQKLAFDRRFAKNRSLSGKAWVGYSFNREQFQWSFDLNYHYAPLHPGELTVSAGNNIVDFMGNNGINPFINSISSLFFKENYARYIHQKFIQVDNLKEIANGLSLKIGLGYYDRSVLENVTNFSFANKKKVYHPNSFSGSDDVLPGSANAVSVIFSGELRYVPGQHYRIKEGRKITEWSNWPEFALSYRKGVDDWFGSVADWNYFELKISQNVKTGVNSNFTYELRGGSFFNSKNIPLSDLVYFKTSPLPVSIDDKTSRFHLMPYYEYRTGDKFFEAHLNYSDPYILLKYLPWICESKWNENLSLSYLVKPGLKNYVEVGYYLSNVFMVGDMGVYAGFEQWKYKHLGFRVTLGF